MGTVKKDDILVMSKCNCIEKIRENLREIKSLLKDHMQHVIVDDDTAFDLVFSELDTKAREKDLQIQILTEEFRMKG
ncbi:hypothetical protein GJ496_011036 [Pomphorhynchus laevis]|nr:hypothetical protein GJ496_011036 [Pomphorhynchus laevis]